MAKRFMTDTSAFDCATLKNKSRTTVWFISPRLPLNEYGTRNIPPGADFYVDLLKLFSRAPGWHFGIENPLGSHEALKSYSGEFRCRHMGSARNAKPVRLWIDVKCERTPENVRVLDWRLDD